MLFDIEDLASSLNSALVWHIIAFWVCSLLYQNERMGDVTSKFLPGLISCSH